MICCYMLGKEGEGCPELEKLYQKETKLRAPVSVIFCFLGKWRKYW